MKKIFITLGLIFTVGITTAQEEGTVSVNLYGGYNLKETVPFDFADIKVSDGAQFGVGLEYFLSRSTSLELKYNRMETDFSTSFIDINSGGMRKSVSSNGSLSYVLFGGNGYFIQMDDSKVIPFIGASLGIGIVDSDKTHSNTSFAWDAKVGVKIKTNSALSFKLNAYVQSILSAYGTDYWYYWGYYYPVPDYHRIFQFGLGGAVTFDFGPRNH